MQPAGKKSNRRSPEECPPLVIFSGGLDNLAADKFPMVAACTFWFGLVWFLLPEASCRLFLLTKLLVLMEARTDGAVVLCEALGICYV